MKANECLSALYGYTVEQIDDSERTYFHQGQVQHAMEVYAGHKCKEALIRELKNIIHEMSIPHTPEEFYNTIKKRLISLQV